MLINNWEYLRLQIFGHQLAILHHIGRVSRIDGDILQCRAAFECFMAQIRQAGWDVDRLLGGAVFEHFIFFEDLNTLWKRNGL